MFEPAEGPGAPLLGRHRVPPGPATGAGRQAAGGGYRRVIGAHRAPGLNSPSRGYLFTVALLAGTASMPILAAISAGSATVGNSALPDSSTPFIPTPSVGPVVIALPEGTQPPVTPTRTPVAAANSLPAPPAAAAPALPDDSDLRTRRPSRPPAPAPVRTPPTVPPRPSPVPSPSASGSATPDPTPSTTAEPTSTLSEPAPEPSTTPGAEPSEIPSPPDSPSPTSMPPAGSPSPTSTPQVEWHG